MANLEALSGLVERLGGRKKTAELLGVTPVAIHYWLSGQDELPLARAFHLANFSSSTTKALTVYDLRPDLMKGGRNAQV